MHVTTFRLGYAPIPTFVSVKPGSFKMGELDTKFRNEYGEGDRKYWGAPITPVAIEKDFSLGRTEVTFDHFDYIFGRSLGQMAARSRRPARPIAGVVTDRWSM